MILSKVRYIVWMKLIIKWMIIKNYQIMRIIIKNFKRNYMNLNIENKMIEMNIFKEIILLIKQLNDCKTNEIKTLFCINNKNNNN